MLTLDVAFTFRSFRPAPRQDAVVVDVLRATSVATLLLAHGARRLLVPGSVAAARRLAVSGGAAPLVCAEAISGRLARGCDVPPSPTLLTSADVRGRDVVFATTNGTRAIWSIGRRSDRCWVGALLNADAVARAAVRSAVARGSARVVVVCAGRHAGTIPCLDDTYTAGVLIQRMEAAARELDAAPLLTDAARIAGLVARAYGAPREALAASASAAVIRRAGAEADVAACAALDTIDIAPRVSLSETSATPNAVVVEASDDEAGCDRETGRMHEQRRLNG